MLKKPTISFRLRAALTRHPHAIWLGSVVFAMLMLSLTVAVLLQARTDAILRATENAENLAHVLEHDITYAAELTDLSVQAAVDGVQNKAVMQIPDRLRAQALFDKSATASKYIGMLLYLDADGKIIANSGPPILGNPNVANRDWFMLHRNNPHLGLYISRPLQSLLNPGEVYIMFSRRVDFPDGSFAGVVAAAFRLDYFQTLLSGIELGPGGTITLSQSDGNVILRYPPDGASLDESLSGRTNFERFKKTLKGSFFSNSRRDGERRLYIYRKFEKLKMVVVIAPTSRYVFADWTSRAWCVGVTSILLALGLVCAAWLLSAEFRHRLKVEAHLRMVTDIDGLTGLSNRRSLDDHLLLEWSRSKRSGKPLAFLFVDIDWFKRYNDTYGHQAGDGVLTAVARAIARSVQRPTDIAARFGGEEFVVLLPDTETPGASRVAAAIHSAVGALAIEHAGSEYAVVTVSIGLACTDSGDAANALSLVRLADQAAYRAKAAGRNRTCAAEPSSSTAAPVSKNSPLTPNLPA